MSKGCRGRRGCTGGVGWGGGGREGAGGGRGCHVINAGLDFFHDGRQRGNASALHNLLQCVLVHLARNRGATGRGTGGAGGGKRGRGMCVNVCVCKKSVKKSKGSTRDGMGGGKK